MLESGETPRFARAAAFDEGGELLGMTEVVELANGKLYGNSSSIWAMEETPSDDDVDVDDDSDGNDTDNEGSPGPSKALLNPVFALLVVMFVCTVL